MRFEASVACSGRSKGPCLALLPCWGYMLQSVKILCSWSASAATDKAHFRTPSTSIIQKTSKQAFESLNLILTINIIYIATLLRFCLWYDRPTGSERRPELGNTLTVSCFSQAASFMHVSLGLLRIVTSSAPTSTVMPAREHRIHARGHVP